MAYVTVPKDLTKIKSKVMFNLTKKTITLFRRGGGYRATAILFDKGQRGNDNGGFVHGACHVAHVPTRYVREERATAGSDYTAICGSGSFFAPKSDLIRPTIFIPPLRGRSD